jgi:hypothetical protein
MRKFVEALVPSACGFGWALDNKRPQQLVRFGYINSYSVVAAAAGSQHRPSVAPDKALGGYMVPLSESDLKFTHPALCGAGL